MAAGQEATISDQTGQLVGPNSDQQDQHQQYMIVNSPSTQNEPSSQLLANQLASANVAAQQGSLYTSIYPTSAIQQTSSLASGSPTAYAVKYIPAYQQQVQSAVVAAPVGSMAASAGVAASSSDYSSQGESMKVQSLGRYGSCLETCNPMDHRWRKYSISKYKQCCSRLSQSDAQQYDMPNADKVSEASYKYADDAYYNYLYKRSRSRRSRRTRDRSPSSGRYHTNGRYSSSQDSSASSTSDDDNGSISGNLSDGAQDSERGVRSRDSGRSYHEPTSPYMKYYKIRNQPAEDSSSSDSSPSGGSSSSGSGKYSKDRFYRQSRTNRDFSSQDSLPPAHSSQHESMGDDDTSSYPIDQPSRSYGNGEYSVSDGNRYSSGTDSRNPSPDDDDARLQIYDENTEPELGGSHSGKVSSGSSMSDYPPADSSSSSSFADQHNSQPSSEFDGDSESSTNYNKKSLNSEQPAPSSGVRRRKQHSNKGKTSRKSIRDSFGKYLKKNKNKSRHNKADQPQTSQYNGTADFDTTQSSADQYHSAEQGNTTEDDQPAQYQKDSTGQSSDMIDGGIPENKFKSALNDSTVANLSKTTMHLKEILSILEKKAHLKTNESTAYNYQQQQQQQSSPAPLTPTTTTTTTTTSYPPSLLIPSQFGSQASALQTALSSADYLSTDFAHLKSPYRYDPASALSSLSSSSLSLSPSSYSSLSVDPYPNLSNYAPNHYAALAAAASVKHLQMPHGHHQRKRRPNRNLRYNNYALAPKQHHNNLGTTSPLLHAASMAAKIPFLNQAYYSMHNPYWYNRGISSATHSYPHKNPNRNYHSPIVNGHTPSKLQQTSNNLYSDESRIQQVSNYDPLINVASSLRPTTSMRFRPKPFVFQPHHVLPIYTRHTILTQPLDVKN